MKKFLAFILLMAAPTAPGGVSIGGGSGSSKTLTELATIAFGIEKLPSVLVDSDTLRRAEARLSIEGMETVEMPLGGSTVAVKKVSSAVVDTDITKRFVAESQ
ncbi:MAG: hypothetical protein M3Q07_29010 [Pseudobdellovibrionaceae bacterium]|nr:hypothetical protein [Pseudobdellovibrionaceae bacterium]